MAREMVSAGPQALTGNERDRLAELEATIDAGLATFVAVGSALAEIRESRLYRAEYPTFEAYCRDRWDMGASRARQLMAAADVVASVESVTTVTPANEAQARPLAPLPPEQRREAWGKAVDTAQAEGKAAPTQAQVKAATDDVRGVEPPADDAPDLAAEMERMSREIDRLQGVVASLQATDQGREILAWSAKYAQLNARLMQEITRANEAAKTATYATKLLAKIRGVLGVEANSDILPQLAELVP